MDARRQHAWAETGFQPSYVYGYTIPGASAQADMRRAFGPQNRIQISMVSAESAFS